MFKVLRELFLILRFLGTILKLYVCTSGHSKAILGQILTIFQRSFFTILISGLFVGGILVLQFYLVLANYNAESLLGGLNTSATLREVGPLMISFLLAGKIGAYTAAELGTMRMTEQIDAIECLGTNSLSYLVLPRLLGIIFCSPILLVIGLCTSFIGSALIAECVCGMSFLQYFGSVSRFMTFATLGGGIFKSCVYGTIIASVSCYNGYFARSGAKGVGRAVTATSVYVNLIILFANYVITRSLSSL